MRITLKLPCLRMNFAKSRCLSGCKSKKRKYRKVYKRLVAGCDKDLLGIGFAFCLLLLGLVLLVWLIIRDKCETEIIVQSVCQDYQQGKIAGSWCYNLCIEKSIELPGCYDQTSESVTFHYKGSVVKVPFTTSSIHLPFPHGKSQHSKDLQEPLSLDDFESGLTSLLHSKLGHVDVSKLLEKIYTFFDFNGDGSLSYGEANSIWRLMNIHEFFILFIFQGDTIFPQINGSCGSLYAYQYVIQRTLYKKDEKGFLDKFFSNTYRWQLPEWKKRANIAVELLNYGTMFSELYNSKFYLCDFFASKFSHTAFFEAKIDSFQSILTEHQVGQMLQQKHCRRDLDCVVGTHCRSSCNYTNGKCSNFLQRYSQGSICEIIKDYLLFDAPLDIKLKLDMMLTQCVSLGHEVEMVGDNDMLNAVFVNFNILLDKLRQIIWDQIKNEPPGWLKPPKSTRKVRV